MTVYARGPLLFSKISTSSSRKYGINIWCLGGETPPRIDEFVALLRGKSISLRNCGWYLQFVYFYEVPTRITETCNLMISYETLPSAGWSSRGLSSFTRYRITTIAARSKQSSFHKSRKCTLCALARYGSTMKDETCRRRINSTN